MVPGDSLDVCRTPVLSPVYSWLLEWITNIPPAAYEEFYNLALIEWLHDFTSNPQCLLQNCRLALRKCLGINLTQKYET